MDQKLKTIEEHERERVRVDHSRDYLLNGIACPKCQKELYDEPGNMLLTSDPPRKPVVCLHCGWHGSVSV